jgi:hypothetical protein
MDNVLNIASTYEAAGYNLVSRNCTTFGMAAAHASGIEVKDAMGTIPIILGGIVILWFPGYNPASMGQSLIQQQNVSKYNNGSGYDGGQPHIESSHH